MVLSKGKKKNSGTGDFVKQKNKVGKKHVSTNATNTSFKAKRVNVRLSEQLNQDGSNIPRSHRNLSLSQLISRTDHHNQKERKNAFLGILQLINDFPSLVEDGPASVPVAKLVFSRICASLADFDVEVRKSVRAALKVLLANCRLMLSSSKASALLGQIHPILTHPNAGIKDDGILALNLILMRLDEMNCSKETFESLASTIMLVSKILSDRADQIMLKGKSGVIVKAFECLEIMIKFSCNYYDFEDSEYRDNSLNAVDFLDSYFSEINSKDETIKLFDFMSSAFLKYWNSIRNAFFAKANDQSNEDFSLGNSASCILPEMIRQFLCTNVGFISLFRHVCENSTLASIENHLNAASIRELLKYLSVFLSEVFENDSLKSYQTEFVLISFELFKYHAKELKEAVPDYFVAAVQNTKDQIAILYRARKPDSSKKLHSLCSKFNEISKSLNFCEQDQYKEFIALLYSYYQIEDLHPIEKFQILKIIMKDFSEDILINPNDEQKGLLNSGILLSIELSKFARESEKNAKERAAEVHFILAHISKLFCVRNSHNYEFCNQLESSILENIFSVAKDHNICSFDSDSQDYFVNLIYNFENCKKDAIKNYTLLVTKSSLNLVQKHNLLWNGLYSLCKPVLISYESLDMNTVPHIFSGFLSLLISIGFSERSDCFSVLNNFMSSLPLVFTQQLPKLLIPKVVGLLSKANTKDTSVEMTKFLNLLSLTTDLITWLPKCGDMITFLQFMHSHIYHESLDSNYVEELQFKLIDSHTWIYKDWICWLKSSNYQKRDFERVNAILTLAWSKSSNLIVHVRTQKEDLKDLIAACTSFNELDLSRRLKSQYLLIMGEEF